jgi:hypothetical protein
MPASKGRTACGATDPTSRDRGAHASIPFAYSSEHFCGPPRCLIQEDSMIEQKIVADLGDIKAVAFECRVGECRARLDTSHHHH